MLRHMSDSPTLQPWRESFTSAADRCLGDCPHNHDPSFQGTAAALIRTAGLFYIVKLFCLIAQ